MFRTRTLTTFAIALLATLYFAPQTSAHPLQLFSTSAPDGDNDDGMIYDGYPRAASMVGWLSIACWIIVYSPQLWLSYVQQSGEGLSLFFVCIWLAGDLTNLLGAIWQGLLPTVQILAIYYSLCDIVLLFQIFYYRRKRALYPELFLDSNNPTETDALLSSFSASGSAVSTLSKKSKKNRDVVAYLASVAAILLVGAVAWKLSEGVPEGRHLEVWNTKAQVVGWISAFLYLGSRLPQIAKNMETKCQGLSLLMFSFSVCGNVTYVSSILLQSFSAQHILINASWLVGSGGTIFLDAIVLSQFWWYQSARNAERKVFADDGQLADDDSAII